MWKSVLIRCPCRPLGIFNNNIMPGAKLPSELRLLAHHPWFKELSHQDIDKKMDRKSLTGSHYTPHE